MGKVQTKTFNYFSARPPSQPLLTNTNVDRNDVPPSGASTCATREKVNHLQNALLPLWSPQKAVIIRFTCLLHMPNNDKDGHDNSAEKPQTIIFFYSVHRIKNLICW